MFAVLLCSVFAFIGTNVDDIFLLTLFFSEARTKSDAHAVVCGQYLGVIFLYFLSVLGAFGLSFLPESYIGFLGILPIILGVKAIFDRSDEDDEKKAPLAVRFASLLSPWQTARTISGCISLSLRVFPRGRSRWRASCFFL